MNVIISRNLEHKGIEIRFDEKPEKYVTDHLRASLKMQYLSKRNYWYKRYTPDLWQHLHEYFDLPISKESPDNQIKPPSMETITVDKYTLTIPEAFFVWATKAYKAPARLKKLKKHFGGVITEKELKSIVEKKGLVGKSGRQIKETTRVADLIAEKIGFEKYGINADEMLGKLRKAASPPKPEPKQGLSLLYPDIPIDELQEEMDIGEDEELEHTSDHSVARQIAYDHLKEDPKYYSKLKAAGLTEAKKEKLSYNEFKEKYQYFFKEAGKYKITESGSGVFIEKMAKLADEYPEYEKRLESELDEEAGLAEDPKFNVGDVVANTVTKTISIVRLPEEQGEVKTDADGNVSVSNLVMYDPEKHGMFTAFPSEREELRESLHGKGLAFVYMDTDPKSKDKETEISEAEQLGRNAFLAEKKRIPAHDAVLMKMLEGKQVGESPHIMESWLSGWDQENLKKADPLDIDENRNLDIGVEYLKIWEEQKGAIMAGVDDITISIDQSGAHSLIAFPRGEVYNIGIIDLNYETPDIHDYAPAYKGDLDLVVQRLIEIRGKQTEGPSIQEEIEDAELSENLLADSYDDSFTLNKAIERLLDVKWQDHIDDWTTDEKEFISRYSGYGGLDEFGEITRGSLFEYYTPDTVIEKMWGLAHKHGYDGGSILEPSIGVGSFFNRQFVPEHVYKVAYETNKYSAKIVSILYPEVFLNDNPWTGETQESMYFEEVFIKNNYTVRDKVGNPYSLVIGNPPYGSAQGKFLAMGEKSYTNAKNYIDYFISRGLDLLKPSGLLIYIVGAEVAAGGKPWLDQGNSKAKEAIDRKADLIDAYRLPNGVFERTDVVSDIIVMRKT